MKFKVVTAIQGSNHVCLSHFRDDYPTSWTKHSAMWYRARGDKNFTERYTSLLKAKGWSNAESGRRFWHKLNFKPDRPKVKDRILSLLRDGMIMSEIYANWRDLDAASKDVVLRWRDVDPDFDAAIAEDHAKAPAAAAVGPQIVSIQEFIIEDAPEWSAWNQHLRETTGKGSPVTDKRGVLRRGWFRPTLVPPGYDEATGEKRTPSAENAA